MHVFELFLCTHEPVRLKWLEKVYLLESAGGNSCVAIENQSLFGPMSAGIDNDKVVFVVEVEFSR